jgi:hypothetical protein
MDESPLSPVVESPVDPPSLALNVNTAFPTNDSEPTFKPTDSDSKSTPSISNKGRRSIIDKKDSNDPFNLSFQRRSKLLQDISASGGLVGTDLALNAAISASSFNSSRRSLLKTSGEFKVNQIIDDAPEVLSPPSLKTSSVLDSEVPVPSGPRLSIYKKFNASGGVKSAGIFSMTEQQKRMLRLIWESDFYATRFNSVLKDVPEIAHFLPIELGGDEIYEKIQDGWLIACFINRIPGYYKYVDLSALKQYEPNPDFKDDEKTSKNLPLSFDHKQENIRYLLDRIHTMPIRSTGVTAFHFSDPKVNTNRTVMLDLLRQIVKLETVELLSHSLVEIGTIRAKKMKDSGLKRFDALEAFRQSGRQATVTLNDGRDRDEVMIRRFINESLERGEFSERLSDSVSLADGLYNSIIYTQVLHYLDSDLSLEPLRMGDDIIGKAQIVLDNAQKIGVQTPFKSFHLAFGGDEIHFNFIAAIAICAHLREIRKLEELLESGSLSKKGKEPSSPSSRSVKEIFAADPQTDNDSPNKTAGAPANEPKLLTSKSSSSEAGSKRVKQRSSALQDIQEKATLEDHQLQAGIPETTTQEERKSKPIFGCFWCSCSSAD